MKKAPKYQIIPCILSIGVLSLCSCTANVDSIVQSPNLKLRRYNNIFVALIVGAGATSKTSGDILNINSRTIMGFNSSHLMEGDKQALLSFESLQFELLGIGFNIVNDETKADAIVDFSIGTIRYDAVAGWIADQGFLKFKEIGSGNLVAMFRANTQFVTPTVNNIVSSLCGAVRSHY